MKHNIFLITALAATIILSQPVFADNGYVLQIGKQFPLCREMLEILNLPENTHSLGFRTTGKEFTIPKKYKNFEMVQWTQIHNDEITKYINPETLKALELVKQRAINIEKDWDGKGYWEFEIAQVNIDGHGKAETMLRYRLPNWKKPSCMLADTESAEYREAFNPYISYDDLNKSTYGLEKNQQCQVFKYKGRAYNTGGGSSFVVREPKPLPHWGDEDPYIKAKIFMNDVCQLWNPHWENESTGELK